MVGKMSLPELLALLISLELAFSQTLGTVCNQTGKVNELQANIDAVKREVDLLRNTSKLLLDHYMLPHIQSSRDQCATLDQPGPTDGEPLSTGVVAAASTIPSSVASFLVGSLFGAVVHHCFTKRRAKPDDVANKSDEMEMKGNVAYEHVKY